MPHAIDTSAVCGPWFPDLFLLSVFRFLLLNGSAGSGDPRNLDGAG